MQIFVGMSRHETAVGRLPQSNWETNPSSTVCREALRLPGLACMKHAEQLSSLSPAVEVQEHRSLGLDSDAARVGLYAQSFGSGFA